MLKRPVTLAAVLILCCTSGALAGDDDLINADRPGIADGSAVVGPGRFQTELGFQRARTSSDGTAGHAQTTPLLLRYGLQRNFELRLETDGERRLSQGRDMTSGLAPLFLGFKWKLQDQPEGRLLPSLAVIARVAPPSGATAFRSHHVNGDVRVVADLDLSDRWSLNPNAGVTLTEDDSGALFVAGLAALTVTFQFHPRLQTFVDAGLQAPESKGGGASLVVDGGLVWIVGRDTQLDVAFGPGASGRSAPVNFWTAGISRRF